MSAIAEKAMDVDERRDHNGHSNDDEEKAFLPNEQAGHKAYAQKPLPIGLSRKFWFFAAVNTLSTVGIVFVNKRLFSHERLKHCQVTIAAFHFAVTALTLYAVSRPRINVFQAKRVHLLKILPLAISMICNVVLLNLSLAYSSIQFYQIVRVLVTPAVALMNYIIVRATIPVRAALTLVPVCVGVAVVSYFDTASHPGASEKTTAPIGVVLAFAALFASAVYTVWIDKYHRVLDCTSMQLLLNQAPMSVGVMLFVIPFSDDITVWAAIDSHTWMLVLLSGMLACLINLSQFLIINEAGPVSSTVVGHSKTCLIVATGWITSGKALSDSSLIGTVMAIGGIIAYSVVMQNAARN